MTVEALSQFGFAAVMCGILILIISQKMDKIIEQLSGMKTELALLTQQQEGGYKIVIESLLQSFSEEKTRRVGDKKDVG